MNNSTMSQGVALNAGVLDALLVECMEDVKRLAWKYVRSMRHTDVDDLVSLGLETLALVVPNAVGIASNVRAYAAKAVEHDFINYLRDGKDDLLRRPAAARTSVVQSLDAPLGFDSDGFTLYHVVADESVCEPSERDFSALYAALGTLDVGCRKAIEKRYGLNGEGRCSYPELAIDEGISKSTAFRRCERGIEALRNDRTLLGLAMCDVWDCENEATHFNSELVEFRCDDHW